MADKGGNMINFDPAALYAESGLYRIVTFGCSEDGAIVLSNDRQDQTVILMPCGPEVWIRIYAEAQGLTGRDCPYGSYFIGSTDEVITASRSDFVDLVVVQGLDMACELGLADETGKVLPVEEEGEDLTVNGAGRLTVNVIVRMQGGTIEKVMVEESGIDLTVIFTEAPKYLTNDEEVFIQGSSFDGDGIYTVCTAGEGSVEDFAAVKKAAEEYEEQANG